MSCRWNAFTFQYVSINTHIPHALGLAYTSLHSNMFLLIRIPKAFLKPSMNFTFQYVSINTSSMTITFPVFFLFTFQYVSINTVVHPNLLRSRREPLHSNMFLLIPKWEVIPLKKEILTLHSNMFLLIPSWFIAVWTSFVFTFQYVSINTCFATCVSVWFNSLYIPICFY